MTYGNESNMENHIGHSLAQPHEMMIQHNALKHCIEVGRASYTLILGSNSLHEIFDVMVINSYIDRL